MEYDLVSILTYIYDDTDTDTYETPNKLLNSIKMYIVNTCSRRKMIYLLSASHVIKNQVSERVRPYLINFLRMKKFLILYSIFMYAIIECRSQLVFRH